MAHPTGEGWATRSNPYRKAGAGCCRISTRSLCRSSSSCSSGRSPAAAATAAELLLLLKLPGGRFLGWEMASCALRGGGICMGAAGGGQERAETTTWRPSERARASHFSALSARWGRKPHGLVGIRSKTPPRSWQRRRRWRRRRARPASG